MKKSIASLLAAAAVVSIGAASIGTASAYFTTQASAKGTYTITLGSNTDIDEPEVAAGTKHLVVSNEEGGQDVYVRAKAFAGGDVDISYSSDTGNWTDGGDGYYYYSQILTAGSSSEELLVHFEYNNPDVEPDDTYNVIVVYESTPVQYNADGSPYADWELSEVVEGGAEG